MGSNWGIVIAGAAIGAGLYFGMEKLGEGLRDGMTESMKNIGFEDQDIELGKIQVRKVKKNSTPCLLPSPPSPATIGGMHCTRKGKKREE